MEAKLVGQMVSTVHILLGNGNFKNARTTAGHLPEPERTEMLHIIRLRSIEHRSLWGRYGSAVRKAHESEEPKRTRDLNLLYQRAVECGWDLSAKKIKQLLDGGKRVWDFTAPVQEVS